MPSLEEMRAWLSGDSETAYGESLEIRNKVDPRKMKRKRKDGLPPDDLCFVCEGRGIQQTSGDSCGACGGTGTMKPSEFEGGGVDLERMAAASGRKYTISMDGKDAVLRFGKFKGQKVSDLAKSISGKGYLGWMLTKEFPDELVDIIKLYGVAPKAERHR
jgi:hypothetical protein